MAALRNGIGTVLIPKDNVRDLEEIDQTVRAALQFVPVETVDQVFAAALTGNGDRLCPGGDGGAGGGLCPCPGKDRSHPAAVKEALWH